MWGADYLSAPAAGDHTYAGIESNRFGLRTIVTAIVAGAALMAISMPGLARDYVINTASDTSSSGLCTLRDAMLAADRTPNPTSSCNQPGGENDSITFEPSLARQTISLTSELPTIRGAQLSITGPDSGITISGGSIANQSRAILDANGVVRVLTLARLTFTDAENSVLYYAVSPSHSGAVTITNCVFSNNKIDVGNVLDVRAFSPATVTMRVKGSSFMGNSARIGGILASKREKLLANQA